MARRVFFSFDYRHVWRVNQIRSMPNIIGTAAAGFQDASLWEEAKKKGDVALKRMINQGLHNTSVTVVCVAHGTAGRKWIEYEIDRSLEIGNGLVAMQIHELKDQNQQTATVGAIPNKIKANGFKAYKYVDKEKFARRIEEAARIAGR